MKTNYKPCGIKCRQLGVSLVELMVAVVIGLVLLAGITQLYLGSKRSYTALETLARLQENGRYAIDVLARDLRRAGYWGGNADISMPATAGSEGPYTPPDNTCNTGDSTWGRMVERRVFGIDRENSGAGYGACIPAGQHVAGDILVTRYAAPSEVTDTIMDANPKRIYMRSSLFASRIFLGGDHADSANEDVKEPNRVSALIANAYYISASVQQCQGNSIPALHRIELNQNGNPLRPDGSVGGQELALGVEQIQVQWGLDTNGNSSVNQYVDANGVADWDQVIAARVWVLMRGECPEPGANDSRTYRIGNLPPYTPNDDFRRQLYVTTVMLRNPNF